MVELESDFVSEEVFGIVMSFDLEEHLFFCSRTALTMQSMDG